MSERLSSWPSGHGKFCGPEHSRCRTSFRIHGKPMRKLFILTLGTAMLAPFSAPSQEAKGTLAGFLSGQGLAGAKLERRYGNHLFVPASINNQHAALMIDTGAPFTLIDKN